MSFYWRKKGSLKRTRDEVCLKFSRSCDGIIIVTDIYDDSKFLRILVPYHPDLFWSL